MEQYQSHAVTDVRQLVVALRDLGRADAPTTLLPRVMSRVGLGDHYFPLATPLGVVFVAYNGRGLSMVARAETAVAFEHAFRARFARPIYAAPEPPAALVDALTRQLRGDAQVELRFDLRGLSEFERAVLLKALEIPRGEIRPYAWVAREIGHPGAVRAVGTALARNPIPLFIPCHRVVRSDGHIGNYRLGGSEAKRAVLMAEGVALDELAGLARAGVRYYGSATTHIYCFPTCRHARRISEAHRVSFSSAAAAAAAGYRPCKVCRPA